MREFSTGLQLLIPISLHANQLTTIRKGQCIFCSGCITFVIWQWEYIQNLQTEENKPWHQGTPKVDKTNSSTSHAGAASRVDAQNKMPKDYRPKMCYVISNNHIL